MDGRQPLNEIKANLFKGLAHPVRIRVLELLAADAEVPVSTLLAETGMEASHLSQHLAVLRRYQLVESERRGSTVLYRLHSPQVAELLRVARELLGEILRSTQANLALAAADEVPTPARPDPTASSSARAAAPPATDAAPSAADATVSSVATDAVAPPSTTAPARRTAGTTPATPVQR
jgi:DNA-binding transcriptional ArsR family regulator